MKRLWGLTIGAALLVSAAVALATEPPPQGMRTEDGRQGLSLNPNKYKGSDPADKELPPPRRPSECDLTPQEEFVVVELRRRLEQLEEREALIQTREAALATLHGRIERDLATLKVLQRSVGEDLEALRVAQEKLQRRMDDARDGKPAPAPVAETAEERTAAVDARQQRIAQLAGILKKMQAEDAARILGQQTDDIAVAVLDALGTRQAGKILPQMEPKRAVALARGLVDRPVAAGEVP